MKPKENQSVSSELHILWNIQLGAVLPCDDKADIY